MKELDMRTFYWRSDTGRIARSVRAVSRRNFAVSESDFLHGVGKIPAPQCPESVTITFGVTFEMDFDIVGALTYVEAIASGSGIRELSRLRRLYGQGRWRKMKGIARVRLKDGRIRLAELHWYEAHGIGRKEFKRKRFLD